MHLVRRVLQVQLVPMEFKVHKVRLVRKDCRDLLVFRVLLALRVQPGLLVVVFSP